MRSFQLILFAICIIGGSFFAARMQEQEPPRPKPPVTRAKRPTFDKKDWSGIFFEDIFSEGLTGARPNKSNAIAGDSASPESKTDSNVAATSGGWSEMVDGFVLENEIKRWQQEITSQVSTPVKFKTSHNDISEQFAMVAMWFAIIGQYEGDVRWKEEATSARTAFVDASIKSRKSDIAAFNNVKQRATDLEGLVRGEKFPDEPNAKPEFDDWSLIVDRNPIMNRLQLSISEELKKPTSNENEFKNNIELIEHEASLIAAMGRVLQSAEMLDADDDDYNAYAQEMLEAGMSMRAAARQKNLEGVNAALNRINQSCTNCHGDYR